ncbi:aldehyde-activating protein [Hahella sp. CCB-MM4]|uniref:GFA family protein n=1 Tax=Hahella sp. (strain CCB-MM4) TaxID=1926491 RepID=UPI000B9A1976|nr:aldehyde-activating protein [Hahella sp. CCB-MM4]OZG72835.1 aldehyde-activating protein [Hahella sp. CCB-MM4]
MKLDCHCGNIRIETNREPEEITRCNCSICRRYAAQWAYFDPSEVTITFEKEASEFYIWGDRELEFHRCGICGCVTHYVTTPKCPGAITAVNANMASPEVLEVLPVRHVNGAEF